MAATTQVQVGLAGAARGPMLRLDPNALKGAQISLLIAAAGAARV